MAQRLAGSLIFFLRKERMTGDPVNLLHYMGSKFHLFRQVGAFCLLLRSILVTAAEELMQNPVVGPSPFYCFRARHL